MNKIYFVWRQGQLRPAGPHKIFTDRQAALEMAASSFQYQFEEREITDAANWQMLSEQELQALAGEPS